MLAEERRSEIVAYIEEHKAVTVQELMDALDASAATIRRDLTFLHNENRILKVFGGATSLSGILSIIFQIKMLNILLTVLFMRRD